VCGIVGWLDWERDIAAERSVLAKMVETLCHRGPDASGVYLSDHVVLGHRRLSVVDPEGGAQPMIRNRGGKEYVVTYNGELYNTPELRRKLEAAGYQFTTHSDTEVLLTAYMEWGSSCVEKFNGIFAFAIWDEENQRLFLARDRIGVKPLFYARKNEVFLFASEIKALLAYPNFPAEIDREGLAEIFLIGPARTPGNAIFRNMYELKPGHVLTYDRRGIRVQQYWSLPTDVHNDDFTRTVAKVRELIEDAVARQVVADVPVCTMLSGGLDSSALTALICLQRDRASWPRVDTYSVDYVDNERYFKSGAFQPDNDAPWVKRVADYLQTCHHQVMIDSQQLADTLVPAMKARDFPGMADVDTSLYLFCHEIKKGATVALSGECADEIFGGYPWFYRQDMLQVDTFPWSFMTEMRSQWLAPELRSQMRAAEYVGDRYQDALAEVPRLKGEDATSARMREIFYLSLTRFMPTLLDRKDRMSMAFGLEVRVPYCDHRLVEYVWNVPWVMKNYQNREKGLLRKALEGILPDDVLWRKKSPYPKTYHPAYLATVRERLLAILDDPSSPLTPLLAVDHIRSLTGSGKDPADIPWFGQLMKGPQLFAYLIQVDAWLREYKIRIV